MNPKEQWAAFFQRRYSNDATPCFLNLAVIRDSHGVRETGVHGDHKDWFGVQWGIDSINAEVTPDPNAGYLLSEISEWRQKIVFPDLEAIDWPEAARLDGLPEIDRENMFLLMVLEEGPFERLHTLMGFEEALIALLAEPEECEAYLTAWTEWKLKLLEKVKQHYNPDVIMFHDDIGTQKDLFFSPDTWRHFFKPIIKQCCDKCHKLGIFFEYHSCGRIDRVIADLTEIGIDALQIQDINDIVALKQLTGSAVAYHSWPDYQALVARSRSISEQEVRDSIRASFLKNLKGGHYMPLMLPFGDWVTGTIVDEIVKLTIQYGGDPAE